MIDTAGAARRRDAAKLGRATVASGLLAVIGIAVATLLNMMKGCVWCFA